MDFPEAEDERDFTVSFDHQDDNGEYAGEVLEKKVDSLGWKVTLMSIVIPLLIAVVAALAYYSITRKVAEFQNTGSATVQEFSLAYEDKLAEMQKSVAAQQEAVEKKLAAINRNAADITKNRDDTAEIRKQIQRDQNDIKTVRDEIKTLSAAADKLSAAVGGLNKDLATLTAAVGESSRRILALGQKVEAVELRLSGLAESAAQKPDLETIKRMLVESEKKIQPSLNASTEMFRDRLKALEDRITVLERKAAMSPPAGGSSPNTPENPDESLEIIQEEDLR